MVSQEDWILYFNVTDMTRKILLLILLVGISSVTFAQAKKPTIMVVPSDAWCHRNGFVTEFDNMGKIVTVSDYPTAFTENSEIRTMVSAMANFMVKLGFPIQSLEQELIRQQNESAEIAMMMGKNEGGEIAETPVERIRRTTKADIILNLDYTVNKVGPSKQVEFNLQAIDAYSSKLISGNTGTSSVVAASVPVTTILEESVLDFKDNLISQLDDYFRDLENKGREITVTFWRYDTSPIDFEEEYTINGYDVELADIIETWFADNTVEGRFTTAERSANKMRFTQVRIPLYLENPINGKKTAVDANGFVRDLVNMLKKEPYNIQVGRSPKGLGEVWLTLGDK